MVVYSGAYFTVFNAKYLIGLVLGMPKRIQRLLEPHLMAGFTWDRNGCLLYHGFIVALS